MLAAAATVVRAMRPGLDAGQLATLLCRSARDIAPAGWDRRTGCGIPDIAAALRYAGHLPPDLAEPDDDSHLARRNRFRRAHAADLA